MIEVAEEKNQFLAQFAQFERSRAAVETPWLQALRKDAIARFSSLGFPTTRDEEWQYTNVAPITRIPFKGGDYDLKGLSAEKVSEISPAGLRCSQVVFVNGSYSRELSLLSRLQGACEVSSLSAAAKSRRRIEPYLGKYAGYGDHPFVALNTAFLRDGAFVFIPENTIVRDPIQLIYVANSGSAPTVSHPRNLIVVGAGSQATFLESYAGLQGEVYFTNAVTEMVIGENAVVDHYKIQRESEEAFHVATLQVNQGRDSHLTSCSVSLGGRLVRNDLNVVLDGEGAECVLNGLYMVGGSQHVDNHTCIDHAKPHCTSNELYKGVLDGEASGVFNGRIMVRPGAQKTNARQGNKNLLLSGNAVIDTKPQLEICADDVKCAHGATIGQVDENQLFYMRSRGIDRDSARGLLVRAFGGEIIGGIKVEEIQCQLDLIMFHRMSKAIMEEA
jgi:Fe-S cluster assembly protein SufD